MINITPALAGQIVVMAIVATVVAVLVVAGCFALYDQYQEQKARHELRMALRRRAASRPHDVTPWIPGDAATHEDDVHEDFEHMRVVREAAP